MERLVRIAVVAAVGLALVSSAFAERHTTETKKQMKAAFKSRHAEMDTNGDGKVSAEERKAWNAKWFKEMDTNGDGKLSEEEVARSFKANREKMDTNGDGAIELDEFIAWMSGEPSAKKPQKVDKRDADNNGTIDPQEAEGWAIHEFEVMDINKDGKLTPDELKEGAKKFIKSRSKSQGDTLTPEELGND